ncbi:MAG: oligosaccharide flippase family protein [Candidatus Aenigmatarchaeota archaeon]
MKVEKKVFSNTVYLLMDWLVTSAFSFLFWFIIGKTLLPEFFGIISTSINTAILLSGISFLGFHGALIKLIPEFVKKRQVGNIVELNKFTLKIILLSNLIIAIFLLVFSQAITVLVKLPLKVVYLTAVLIVIMSLANFLSYILYGFQNMKKLFLTNLIGRIFNITAVAVFSFLGFSYFGPILAVLFTFFIIGLLRINMSYFHNNDLSNINKQIIFYDLALPLFFSSLAVLVFSSSHFLIISLLQNQEITGFFAIAFLLTSSIAMIQQVLAGALFPVTSELNVGKNIRMQSYLINLIARYSLFLVFPLAMILIFLSKPIILFFSQPQYLASTILFPPLSIAAIFFGLANIMLSSLYALGKTKINMIIWIMSAVFYAISSFLLTYYFSAIGTALAYLLSTFLLAALSYFYLKKSLKEFRIFNNLVKIIASSLVLILLVNLSTRLEVFPFMVKILLLLIGLAAYFLLLFVFKFYRKEDIRVLSYIARRLPLVNKLASAFLHFISKYI